MAIVTQATKSPKSLKTPKTQDHSDWDERRLGADDAFVGVADASHERRLDDSLDMQSISIRLPKSLIRHFKLIADFHGVGYQPLMRDVLQRFIPTELQHILDAQRQIEKTRLSLPLERKKKRA
jgi:predicted DNA binding CopG/RHH family protein